MESRRRATYARVIFRKPLSVPFEWHNKYRHSRGAVSRRLEPCELTPGVDTSRSTAAALKVEVQTLSMWPEARAFCEAERVPQAVGIEGTAAFLGS